MKKFTLLAVAASLFTACSSSVDSDNKNINRSTAAFNISCDATTHRETLMEGSKVSLSANQLGVTSSNPVTITITLANGSPVDRFTIAGSEYTITSIDGNCHSNRCILPTSSGKTSVQYQIKCKGDCASKYLTISAEPNSRDVEVEPNYNN